MSREKAAAYVMFAESYLDAAMKVGVDTFNVSSYTDDGSNTVVAKLIAEDRSSDPSSGFLGVYYFGIGHAVELLLKAYLILQGYPDKALRALGHHIDDTVTECVGRGLTVSGLDDLRMLKDYHEKHVFRYPDAPRSAAPNPAVLTPPALQLLHHLRGLC